MISWAMTSGVATAVGYGIGAYAMIENSSSPLATGPEGSGQDSSMPCTDGKRARLHSRLRLRY